MPQDRIAEGIVKDDLDEVGRILTGLFPRVHTTIIVIVEPGPAEDSFKATPIVNGNLADAQAARVLRDCADNCF